MSLNESNAPRLNKSISPRVPSSINKVPNNDKHGFDMSIDIPVENHDNRHDLPFTPANIVSKHKSNSSHRTKWKDTRSSDGGDGRKVIDALDLHEEEADNATPSASRLNKSRRSKRSIRKKLSSSTASVKSTRSYFRRSQSSPLSQSARGHRSSSDKSRRGESSQAYEKARLEVEKLIKKQKTYLEAQAQITLNEIKKQQQNPNMFLDQSIKSINNLRNMMFPLIREAEEILNQAQRRTRKSHFIYNNSIMNILAKKSATVIGDNIDTLVDLILDSILDETGAVLNDNEEQAEEQKRQEELPMILAQAREEMKKIEALEDDIVNKVNSRLMFEEEIGLNGVAEYVKTGHSIGGISTERFGLDGMAFERSTIDASENGIRINGNKTTNDFVIIRDTTRSDEDRNNELFPGVNIAVTRREKELIVTKNKILEQANRGLGYQDVLNIETNRKRFVSHLKTKEHSLHNTGMNQTQIIELLENDVLMNLFSEVASEFDTVLGNAAGTLIENV